MPTHDIVFCRRCKRALPRSAFDVRLFGQKRRVLMRDADCRECRIESAQRIWMRNGRRVELGALPEPPNPSGLCLCGCGQPTAIATKTDVGSGTLRGFPKKYIVGHNNRKYIDTYEADPGTGCWNWRGRMNKGGYGVMNVGGESRLAHRIMYERINGPIEPGLEVHHTCCNKRCVNPLHLELLTRNKHARKEPVARLTPDDIRTIRRLAGTMLQKEIAEIYGVCPQHIGAIIRGKAWGDVQ